MFLFKTPSIFLEILIFSSVIFFVAVLILAAVDFYRRSRKPIKAFLLSRYQKNPAISPKSEHWWESVGTFNPGALVGPKGRVHLLYRAVGDDGVSRFGYNSSADGFHFDSPLSYPVFAMENPSRTIASSGKLYDLVRYPSGGSWGGSEDPRMVLIDGRIYVIFNTFDGWDFIRIAVVSIAEKDFLEKKWRWSKPLFVSPEHQINKNWVLFPEKIAGKFAVIHSVSPGVLIDYVDKIEDLASGRHVIKSRFGQNKPRKGWDSWWRGVGPPPIKTDKGWLVLYHAIDRMDSHRYKLGALLLDLKNPSRVIGHSEEPLLSPDMWYENDWKPGVVYACGAIIKDGSLLVYYGGGDKYVCVASAPLCEVLSKLTAVS